MKCLKIWILYFQNKIVTVYRTLKMRKKWIRLRLSYSLSVFPWYNSDRQVVSTAHRLRYVPTRCEKAAQSRKWSNSKSYAIFAGWFRSGKKKEKTTTSGESFSHFITCWPPRRTHSTCAKYCSILFIDNRPVYIYHFY